MNDLSEYRGSVSLCFKTRCAKCEDIHMKKSFHSLANKTHLHIKGFAFDLALK